MAQALFVTTERLDVASIKGEQVLATLVVYPPEREVSRATFALLLQGYATGDPDDPSGMRALASQAQTAGLGGAGQ